MSVNKYADDNHKYKAIEFRNNLTCHLKDPKNAAYIMLISEIEGFRTISNWLAHIIEEEVLPERLSRLSETVKEKK